MTNIKDLFNSIAKEASTGRVDCGMMYNVLFETKINGETIYASPEDIKNNGIYYVPTLEINNEEEFFNTLSEYYEKAKDFYAGKIDEEDDFDKTILTCLWNNATMEDFQNPINYINKYISFMDKPLDLSDEYESIGFSEILDSDLEISLKQEPYYEETPYGLYVRSSNGDLFYDYPVVRFGIKDDTAYIYAVQQLSKKDESLDNEKYNKKIHRKLFKVNENFEKEDEIDNITNPENITGINPSALVSLSVLFSKLEEVGITNIEVPSFLPIRYNAKEKSYLVKIEQLRKRNHPSEELEYIYDKLVQEHETIQRNISDKLLRNIRRLEYNFNNIDLTSYPMELDTSTHINLSEYEYCNNPLLQEIYELNKKKSYKK
ncbi:MAG: hypothetical protein K6E99_02425 [Bacilli bacterium]|nr:hypothetical protein [Bacilli bacterium]